MNESKHTNLIDLITSHEQYDLRSEAILAPGEAGLGWSELLRFINDTTGRLASLGIERGKRVALVLPNGPCAATAFLAISNMATAAPLNPGYSSGEFEFYLSDLHADAVVLEGEMITPARQAAGKLGIPVIELRKPEQAPAGIFTLEGDSSRTVSRELSREEDVALVLHTSGTTSRPKIVPLTHGNLRASALNISHSLGLTPADRCLNIMPLFHVHGLMAAVVSSLAAGGSVICTGGLNPDEMLHWLTDLAPTWLTAVPTMLHTILAKVNQNPVFVSKMELRFIRACSSALPPEIAGKLEQVFHIPVLEAYGMTEASHQISVNPQPPAVRKFGSVGKSYGDEVVILDEKGEMLPANTPGEISIRGPNVMGGYESNPDANQAAYSNGWLRTGDLGMIDEDGYIFITGRGKEMINRGGEKISPREIDEVLLQHQAVSQAVAFAIPHPSLGEDIAAAVVLNPSAVVTPQELISFSGEKLVYFKVPRKILILQDIPKGPTGKIQRIGLADLLRQELEQVVQEIPADIILPATGTEMNVLNVWKEVLATDHIGCQDDFLEVGGDSIKAIQILTRLNEMFTIHLTVRDIFDLFNVKLLSEKIDLLIQK